MDDPNPTPPMGALGAALGVKFYRLRTVVQRRWWLLLLAVAAGLAVQAWRVYSKPDLYESTSELMVRPEVKVEDRKINESWETLYGDTIKTLQSQEVRDNAVRRLELEAPQLTGKVDLTAFATPRTSIFTVTGKGTNPEYTRRFVDAVVTEFMEKSRGFRQGTITETTGELSTQLNKIRTDLLREKGALDTFVKENNMQFWTRQMEESVNFLSTLKTRQAELHTEKARLQTLTADQLLASPPRAAQVGKAPPVGAENETTAETSVSGELVQFYLQTTRELQEKQARIEERSRVWKPKHPKLQALQADALQLRNKLDWIRKQASEMTEARKATIDSELKSLDVNIAAWTEKVKEASDKDGTFKMLEENVKRLQGQEDKFQEALLQLSSATDGGLIRQTRKASPPVPVSKGAVKHLLIGLFGGLFIGGFALFMLDRSDDRLSSSTEILEHFSEPILGQIPNVADSRVASGLPLLQPEDERYTYAEAFRSLRSSLIFMPNQAELKTLLVTSAIPNEGKSTIASNLAVTMAAAGARVILIDADLRRGDIAPMFGIDDEQGLSDVLRETTRWKAVVHPTNYPTLWVIPRGPVTNQSAELLLRPVVETMLDDLKAEYDLVIVNTAPILATDDTPTVAPHFDGVLMVMRAQFTSARLTQNALQALYQRQVNVLGLILNCVDTEMPDYYYYRYPKYYAAN